MPVDGQVTIVEPDGSAHGPRPASVDLGDDALTIVPEGGPAVILAILQARLSSTRLPGKVLRPLAGAPMVLGTPQRVYLPCLAPARAFRRRIGPACDS